MKNIKSVEEIFDLANSKNCVVIKRGREEGQRLPAAIVINYQAHYLVQILKAGFVYVYETKPKQSKPFNFKKIRKNA